MAPSIQESVESVESTLDQPVRQKPSLVAPEPEHCPGPESDQAGQGDACKGCPNQAICASAPKGPDPDIPIITERLSGVRHKILILSGKGGVGKSTFSTLLAHAFAANPDLTVGLMDTDICGPSIPKMVGVEGETIHVSNAGWSPVWVSENLGVMSVQFMLPNRDDAIIWRGPKKNGLIKQFLKDVEWGELDYLFVDTPPGTSDEHLSVNSFLKESGIDGAVVVTTPQEVALLDVRKEIDFCRKAGIRVLGLVENMSGFVCLKCKHESQIFKATTGGGAGLCKDMGIPFLGSVPLDPRIGMACDYGESFMESYPDSPACRALRQVVWNVGQQVGEDPRTTAQRISSRRSSHVPQPAWSFKVKRIPIPNYKPDGPRAYRRALRKFGFDDISFVPGGDVASRLAAASVAALNSTGSNEDGETPASGAENDALFVAPVTFGGQQLVMNFDTGSSDTWVFNTNLDTAAQSGHTIYDKAKSTTVQALNGTFNITYGDGSFASGPVALETVDIGGASVSAQAIGLPDDVSDSFISETASNGLVGLAFSSLNTIQPVQQKTFFDNVMADLTQPVFTAQLKHGAVGAYEFGIIDTSAFTGNLSTAAVDSTNGFWQFSSEEAVVNDQKVAISGGSAIADTGTSLILATDDVVGAYWSQVDNAQSTALKSIRALSPLLDRVLVQRLKSEAKTAGGIFLPESSQKELNQAKVLAVGPGGLDREGKRIPMSVKAGDSVLIPQFGGQNVKVGDEEYHLFRDSDLLAKINE
ncbi:hypothetical protein DV737_g617, partial [Chaetothyriales sp. CBS 132003]